MKRYLAPVFTLLVALVGGYYLYVNRSELALLTDVAYLPLFLLVFLAVAKVFIEGVRLQWFTDLFGLKLSFTEWFGLTNVTTLANLVAPFSGGVGLKGMYLKRKHAFPYTKFLSTLGARYLIFFFSTGVFGLVSLLLLGLFHLPLVLLFLGLIIAMIILLYVRLPARLFRFKFLGKVEEIYAGWRLISSRGFLTKLFCLEIVSFLVGAATFYFAFLTFYSSISYLQTFLVFTTSGVLDFISLTPAGLGVKEALVVWVSSELGYTLNVALHAAALARLVSFLRSFILGSVYTYVLSKKL